MSKKEKVPRKQLVDELRMANERILELVREGETWRERHGNAMRKMNAYSNLLHTVLDAAEGASKRTEEMLTWPST